MSQSDFEWNDSAEADDVLGLLVTGPCPHPDCDGLLCRDVYKGTDAVVCDTCGVPAARVWGDGR